MGKEAWLGRTPEKVLRGVVGGVRLLTAATQPLPQGLCWVSFCAAQALLHPQSNRAASGSGKLPTAFPWHTIASSRSGRAPEAVVRPRHAHGASRRLQGLSPAPGWPGERGGWGRGCGGPRQPTSGPRPQMLFLRPHGSGQQQRVLQLRGQSLPWISDGDALLPRALVATLNCPLMRSFSVFLYGSVPRKVRK